MTVWPILLALAASGFQGAAVTPAPNLKDVGIDQHLDAQIPLDLVFTDETGKAVRLGSYFGEKPVILVLAYFRCPMLCTVVLNGLTTSLSKLSFTVGKEFNVLTVSFDPREKPPLAAEKKKNYLSQYGRPGADAGWHFLTGQEDAIQRLTRTVGFRYAYDAKHDQYLHASGIMILTPAGKISRYFYGVAYPSRDLRLGLVEASANKIGSRTDQVLLYCFHYDADSGKYSASILNLVRAGGVLSLAMVLGLVGLLWNARRRVRGKAA